MAVHLDLVVEMKVAEELLDLDDDLRGLGLLLKSE